jgi:hypothetical protein
MLKLIRHSHASTVEGWGENILWPRCFASCRRIDAHIVPRQDICYARFKIEPEVFSSYGFERAVLFLNKACNA